MPDEELRDKRRPRRLLRVGAAITLIGGSSYIAMLASMVRSVLVMRMIGPAARGVQRKAGLVIGYLANADIATRHGLSKELPLAIGARDDARAARIEDATFVAVTGITLLASLGLLIYALFFCPQSYQTRVAYAASAGILLAQEVAQLYWVVLRSWSNFAPLAVGELVRTTTQLVLIVGGAMLLGLTGVMLGWLAAALLLLVYLHQATRIVVRLRLDWQEMLRLTLVGLPIAAISFSDYLLRSVDGTILVTHYGDEQFGLYSLAMQMATYLFAIPRSAGFVLWPRVLETWGADSSRSARHRQVILPAVAIAAAMPVIAGVAWICLPPLVQRVVPDFRESVPSAQVLSLGASVLSLTITTDPALVADNAEPVVVGTKLAGAAVTAGWCWLLVRRHAALIEFAWAACVGYGIAALLSLYLQFRRSCPRRRLALLETALAFAPLAWSGAALWAAHRLVAAAGLSPQSLLGAALALLVFILLSFPCLVYGHVRTGFGHQFRAMLQGRFRSGG